MTTRIYAVKYIGDPRRWEPRNIGVFVVNGERGVVRCVGMTGTDTVDRRGIRWTVRDTEAYAEWVKYWVRTIDRGESGAEEAVKVQPPQFLVAEVGTTWFGDSSAQPEDLAERYFAELVGELHDQEVAPGLRERVEILLEVTGSSRQHGFRRDVPVQSFGLAYEETLKFQYGWRNGHLTVAKRVDLSQSVLVNDALWSFEHLPADIRRLTFTADPDRHDPRYGLLSNYSTVIDVDATDAGDALVSAITATN